MASELSDLRADFEAEFLTQLGEVWRQVTGEPDAYGGQKLRYQKVAEIKCALQRATRPQRTEEGKQSTVAADWEILAPVGVEVVFPDQIRIAGRIYEVRGSDDATSGQPLQKIFVNRNTKP